MSSWSWREEGRRPLRAQIEEGQGVVKKVGRGKENGKGRRNKVRYLLLNRPHLFLVGGYVLLQFPKYPVCLYPPQSPTVPMDVYHLCML